MREVPCEFTERTGIKVFEDDRLPPGRVGVCGLATEIDRRPDGTKVIQKLQIESVAVSPGS